MRQFRDEAGVEWQVYQTERNLSAEQRRDHLLPVEYRHGWLVFETADEKRRLAPIPEGWSELSDQALAGLCASAAAQSRRSKEGGETGASDSHLLSELQSVEERLTKTLDAVCEAPAVEKLDTGELIRVEETLALAASAAKEAISLRRKRRSTA